MPLTNRNNPKNIQSENQMSTSQNLNEETKKNEINENLIEQNKLLAERMNMLEENNENRNKKIDQLIKQTENVAEAYHSSLKNNNQKFVSILNQKLNEIDKDNVLETITKETEGTRTAFHKKALSHRIINKSGYTIYMSRVKILFNNLTTCLYLWNRLYKKE